ncbi:MAG: hypothetical protein SGI98_09110, partial [Verrucomicrobiota bacterium]|nr:hypothetical protein [Verrucomicrobiota bacterium]
MASNQKKLKWYWKLSLIGLVCLALLTFLGIVITFQFLKPYKDKAAEYDLTKLKDMPTTTTIYDRNNLIIGQIFT